MSQQNKLQLKKGDWIRNRKRHLFREYVKTEWYGTLPKGYCGQQAMDDWPCYEIDNICIICVKAAIKNGFPVFNLDEIKVLYPGIKVVINGRVEAV